MVISISQYMRSFSLITQVYLLSNMIVNYYHSNYHKPVISNNSNLISLQYCKVLHTIVVLYDNNDY